MNLVAKPIVENSFWILEADGDKVGTIRFKDTYTVTIQHKSFMYENKDDLCNELQIDFNAERSISSSDTFELHGYPCKTDPCNILYDEDLNLYTFTKTEKSNSYHCAGFYIIQFNHGWNRSFCPKKATLLRNTFKGPFKTKLEMQEQLRLAQHESP